MIVYRISKAKYKNDISGMGAKLYGSRWNTVGISMLYTAENISLAVLETLVHLQEFEIPTEYWLLKIQLPDDGKMTNIQNSKLKKNWQTDEGYTQFIGSEFIKNNQSLILKVPSAIITEEHNYLINPLHKNFTKAKIIDTKEFNFDNRLLSFT
ncbi:RES family NAD+ phosphorylase [Ferruginibacter sp. SUN106]|uniref:RES family NAD+ phosphorylase n=1 Tax=Ferruginibacter sp. SUN106 TaxID=2978348 RepID=UPI003D36117C